MVNTYASLQLHQQRMHGAGIATVAVAVAATASGAESGGNESLDVVGGKERLNCTFCSKTFVTKGHLKVGILIRFSLFPCLTTLL